MAPILRRPDDKTQIPGYNYGFYTSYGDPANLSSILSTAHPLPRQQTHRFPDILSIAVPLCVTCICNILIAIVTSKRNAIDAAQDLHQNAETHTQMTTNVDERSLIKCVAALEEIENVSDDAYRKAMKKFMNPDWREMFIDMSNEMKREWIFRL
ncbi:hypothetical protein QL285_072155 [Trifolium repens]|nr:hypothetical protein QL285_072155 [Trifolium repens]